MISEKWKRIKSKIKNLTNREIKLVAVTKKQSPQVIKEAYRSGLRTFGENYVQEFEEKRKTFEDSEIEWHFIGALQTNKVKKVIAHAHWIHSVDRLSLAQVISQKSQDINHTQDILLQVNVASEKSKAGCSVSEAPQLLDQIQSLTHLRLRGLMTMPPLYDKRGEVRKDFAQLQELSQKWGERLSGDHSLGELSMGTSSDYDIAVEEGATVIRLGEVLLGGRV